MITQYTVGMNLNGRSGHQAVEAEDALAAAQKVRDQFPEAMITYVRKRNSRGDVRHPQPRSAAGAASQASRRGGGGPGR